MLEALLQPATAPFAVCLVLMLVIAAAEVVSLAMGMSASSALDSVLPDIDADFDVDLSLDTDIPDVADGVSGANAPDMAATPGALSQLLGWLCVGRVPVLVLLIVFLTAFGLAGLVLQASAEALLGRPLPALLAVIPALVVAMPAVRVSGLTLAKVMPKEQTEAVSQKRFIGKVAIVIRGTARKGEPAEAKFSDRHGQTHYALIEPDTDDETFIEGTQVILVKQTGSVYRAIRNRSAGLSGQ
ncbi:MAG: YqiJ family protein [Pseudomonadota bacterium]